MRSLTTLVLVASIAWGGCQSPKNTSRPETRGLEVWADKILGVDNSIELNKSKTFALCFQTPSSDHARRKYRYFVVALPGLEIMHEGLFSTGYVKWLDDETIEVVSSSTSLQDGSTKKIINVTSTVE